MKRAFDIVVAAIAIVAFAPLMLLIAALTWLQDLQSPLYPGLRVGRGERVFRMAKFRTMVTNADAGGVLSTARDDVRITPLGRLLRRWKMDELPQLWNILRGEMSFVGPRPNVPKEVALYSDVERGLLSVQPGLTDYASIVFSDLAKILEGSSDPNGDYNRLVRPWKSKLGLHYVASRSMMVDLSLLVLTAVCMFTRRLALVGVRRLLSSSGAAPELIQIAMRSQPLVPTLPPGVSAETWVQHLTYN